MMRYLIIASLFLSVIGLVTFSMFILQEADQTTQWAMRISTTEPDLTIRGQQLTQRILDRMRLLNHFTWINPYAHFSYTQYLRKRDSNTQKADTHTTNERPAG